MRLRGADGAATVAAVAAAGATAAARVAARKAAEAGADRCDCRWQQPLRVSYSGRPRIYISSAAERATLTRTVHAERHSPPISPEWVGRRPDLVGHRAEAAGLATLGVLPARISDAK